MNLSASKTLLAVAGIAGAAGLALGLWGQPLLHALVPHGSAQAASGEAAAAPAPLADGALGAALVRLVEAREASVRDVITLSGKLALDGSRIQQVSARVAGRVDRMAAVEGSAVRAGEPLAWLYSPEYVSAQNEYLLARGALRIMGQGSGLSELQADAAATLEGARQKLRVLGAGEAELAELDRSGRAQPHLLVRAAISGRLIKRNIDPGGYLDVGGSLGTLADLSSLWFLGNAFDADLPRIREGQPVRIHVAGLAPGQSLTGRVSFVSPSVDPGTHAVAVRVQLPNPQGQLKPEMFARAELLLGERRLPVVPRAAVVQDGAESFVVVQRGQSGGKPAYARVPVETQPTDDAQTLAIVRGVRAGERVVVDGSVLIERDLRDRLGLASTAAPEARP